MMFFLFRFYFLINFHSEKVGSASLNEPHAMDTE